MSKKAIWITSIISVIVLGVVAVFLVFYLQSKPETGAGTESQSSDESAVVEETPALITEEQHEAAIEIFRSGDVEGFIERIIQDFADNGIEFNYGNPEHLYYLNVPEIAP